MSTAIITTDSVFGPWIIPSRGQNMIMNFYAKSQSLEVDAVIPEPMFSKQLSMTRWSKKSKNISTVILCSIHQLPLGEDNKDSFVDDMQDAEVHFVLENLSGKGREFLLAMLKEARSFQQIETISYEEANSYEALYDIMQDNKKL